MTRPTPEYQRMVRARYKRNPKHAEVQAVLQLWALGSKQSEIIDGQAKRQQKPFDPGTD